MGNEASSPSPSGPKVGFHVLRVTAGSPGAQAGLAPYFDFIVAANGHVLDKEDTRLVDILRSNLECQVDLAVYSTKTEQVRRVKLTPSLQWGGNGIVGVSTRFCSVASANENVWHILEVSPNSPAAEAGLESQLDYIVGAPDQVFSDSEDFFTLIQTNVGATVQLYVYNLRDDNIRIVSLRPRKDWGGAGCLGCGVGYGLLHRIARDRKATLASYGISIEDTKLGEQLNGLLVSAPAPAPASTIAASSPATAPTLHSTVPSQAHTEATATATTDHSGGQAPQSSSATTSAPQHAVDQSAGEPIAHHSPQQASLSPVSDDRHQAPAHESPSSPTQQSHFTAFVNDTSPPAASASPYTAPSRPLYAPYAPSSTTTTTATSPPTSAGARAPLSGPRTQPLYSPAVRTPLAAHHGSSADGSSSPYAAPAAGATSFSSASAVTSGAPSSTGLPLPAFSAQQQRQPSTPQPYGSSASSTGQYYYPGIGFTNQKRSNLPATTSSATSSIATTSSAPSPASASALSTVAAAPVVTPPRSGGAPPLHGFYNPQQQQPLYYPPTPTTATTPQQQPNTPSSH